MSRSYRREIGVLIVALAGLIVLALLRANGSHTSSVPSTYDTGANGYAALYEFLQREGLATERFELPLTQLPARGSLVVAGDYQLEAIALGSRGLATLDSWVRHGGTLFILGATTALTTNSLGLPASRFATANRAWSGCGFRGRRIVVSADFPAALRASCSKQNAVLLAGRNGAIALSVRRGRGHVVEVVTPAVFDNLHLSRDSNATFAYDLFSRGAVAFDERIFGYVEGRSFFSVLPWLVKIAIAIVLASLLLAIIGGNLPFAPARTIERVQQRDSSEYIASLARLLQRGHAGRDAILRLVRALPHKAAGRHEFTELNDLAERYDPAPRDVYRAGVLFAALRKDYP